MIGFFSLFWVLIRAVFLLKLFGLRSWTSLRLMTLDQRRELMRRVEEGGLEKRMTVTECASLARELDLSVEQVLPRPWHYIHFFSQ